MKRAQFILVAAIVPVVFGSIMMLQPDLMLTNSLAIPHEVATSVVAQWVGFGVFSLGVINFLSRHDPGSRALRAVMIGNVVFHTLGIGFDGYGYLSGVMTAAGLISGVVPHSLLAAGFLYYLMRMAPSDEAVTVSVGQHN